MFGKLVKNIKAIIISAKNKVLEFTTIIKLNTTKECGKTEGSTEMVAYIRKATSCIKADGSMEILPEFMIDY